MNNLLWIDDVLEVTTSRTYDFNLNCYIFNANKLNFDSSQCGAIIQLYYFKIFNLDNELIRDFIPVKRKSDDAICLYDKVSMTFFENLGTGTFTAGPVKE